MWIQIRIGRVAIQWELHGFHKQFGWGRVEVGWIRTSSDATRQFWKIQNGRVAVV